MALSRYAIVSDITPSRCLVEEVIETEADMLDISSERDLPLRRIMWIAEGVEIEPGDRAWHDDDTITRAGR